MIRAIRRFVSSLTGARRYVFFLVLFLICVVALCVGIYGQFFYKYADIDPLMIGVNIGSKKTEEEIVLLKSEFNSLFKNDITINSENVNVDKIEPMSNLVYTCFDLEDKDQNFHDVNVKIPIINIDTEEAKKINSEIMEEFYNTANNIMRKRDGSTVYNVVYAAFINDEILSLVIKSSLKEEGKTEKVVIKTYNYSIAKERKISFTEILESKGIIKQEIQNNINQEIRIAYNNAKIISQEYGILYERDLNSDIYKIENIDNYFITHDGYVYVVYSYGNYDYTNEVDIVIF